MNSRTKKRLLGTTLLILLLACSTAPVLAASNGDGGKQTDNRVNLWPVLHYDDPVLSVMWPISRFDSEKGHNRVFPIFWGDDYFVAFPAAWWTDDFKGVLPLFWWEDGMTLFPLAWYEKDERCHFFPLWLHDEYAGGHDTWAAWPVFRMKKDGETLSGHVWPFYGNYTEEGARYRFALWPLCHDWRDDDSSLTITPVWSAGARGETRWNMVFPLYHWRDNPLREENHFITPLAGRTQTGDRSRWFFFPLASSVAWGEDEKDMWIAAPIAHFRWGGDDAESHVLPFYYYGAKDNKFLSPLFSRRIGDDDGFVNLLTVLAHYSYSDDGRKSVGLFPPLTEIAWGGRPHHGKGWLFSYHTSEDDDATVGERKSRHVRIARWAYFEKYYSKGGRRKGLSKLIGEGEGQWNRNGWWPLWQYSSCESRTRDYRSKDFSLGGILYDQRTRKGQPTDEEPDKTEDYLRRRVLWRLVHYERTEDEKTLDVFPGITWDSNDKGHRKFSFLWRLFRNERTEDGGRNLDILFIPLMRKNGSGS